MKIPRRSHIFPTVLAFALGAGMSGLVLAQEGGCMGNREIQDAVSSGEVRSLDAVLAEAGVDSSQSVLNVQVCDRGGRLVYVVGVLSPSGEARNLELGAR